MHKKKGTGYGFFILFVDTACAVLINIFYYHDQS